MKNIGNFQNEIGINFRSYSRRQTADALIRYNNIVDKLTFNNVLDIRHKQRQNCPVSERMDAYNV